MTQDLGEPADGRMIQTARDAVVNAIEEVGGREVFFACTLDGAGVVVDVDVVARGTEGAVPAFLHTLEKGQAVLHNHPSGNIAPSDADVQLAALFGFNGHGVYICDNACERVYVVVEPPRDKVAQQLDPAEFEQLLQTEGPISKLIPQFELRPQQIEMMREVSDAFNTGDIAVTEAPTGVGKSFAYLIPAVVWAMKNKERVVISTKTINLQEQLIHKDLPVLQKCLDAPIRAVLVKGRRNYLCWRKLNRALSEATLFDEEGEGKVLKSLHEWAQKTEDGSLSDLPFVPPRDVWDNCCSEADTCRINQCANPGRCFIGKARRDIARADLLIVNHHMLFSDLAIKRETGQFGSVAVLPAYKRLIFDEAHSIEDSATEYFGADVTRLGALQLLGRFVRSDKGRERGLLPFIKVKLMRDKAAIASTHIDDCLDCIDNGLQPAIVAARSALNAAFDALRSLVSDRTRQMGREIKWRMQEAELNDPELREIHKVYVLPAAEEVNTCAEQATILLQRLKKLPKGDGEEAPLATEIFQIEAYRDRLLRLANNLAEGTSAKMDPNTVRWIEIDVRNPRIVRIIRCPLDVGEPLSEWVYSNLGTVVMTSATLSVRHSFDYLKNRIGLDRVVDREVNCAQLDSPFDFQEQAMLAIPTDIPTPQERDFNDVSIDCIREVLDITRGHAFILFTAYGALDRAYRALEGELKASGITPLRQGQMARTQLLERFRSDTSSVLFGTDSFWEGVDVAGDALQCVIVPKLPFRVPTEPIQEARAQAIDEAGGNSFMHYTVPQAVIKFRQGIGRLIRRTTDRGALVLLDRRVTTKHYGRVFLESLPDMRVISGPREGAFMALRRFFEEGREDV